MSTNLDPADAERNEVSALRERVDALEAELAAVEPEARAAPGTATIVATKGTLDMAFPPMNLASTAAAFGWDVGVFFTLWGLDVLHEERSRQLPMSAVGNPNLPVPNLVGVLPGMDAVAARMMKRRMQRNGNATIEELVDLCLDTGVELIACGTTIDLMGYDRDDFYDGVTVGPGAPTAFRRMAASDVQLFV